MATKRVLNKSTYKDYIFDIFNYLFLIILMIVTLYPFLNVLAISLNESTDTIRGGIYIWPREFTFNNYLEIAKYENLVTGFGNSVLRTVVGTLFGVFIQAMVAFTLSRTDFQGRRFVSTVIVLTMYFSGGLIPGYMLIRDLHLMNTFWVYILPGLVSAFNIIIIRSFMDGLPFSLQESAKMDGANDFTIFYRIILPLCKPVLATIALFVAVGQWNSWFDTYLYNSMNENLTTLQYELMKILENTTMSGNANANQMRPNAAQQSQMVSPDSIKMAITMVTVVPIVLVYPFLQKYFIQGMTLGAVKQ
ncbi:carbohydrate ABC transporter permease [Lederbergia galactosidilytica]|uniref:Sugar ABC transporter permease n=1 Tax=Lederbergia galactosidilytica TaxID=217031 RepID=A0A177ZM55_9BACI|nr:carbohydrate ABC transporter permease [Lederbergia galactosidilytica]KRG15065.1 sugar ABC transporter permease [Virgibacillus soli]MBP1913326.1 putative aldouronate transport system permease protein [Lederbergia galactosidilytica]OAK67968.1 sugar ABC transporter permease [Lederbergia galactosidilytica]